MQTIPKKKCQTEDFKRRLLISLIGTLLIVFLIFILNDFVNASASFEDFNGNYSGIFKIDPPIETVVYIDDGENIVSNETDNYVSFTLDKDGTSLSFTTKNVLITEVYLKGADNYRIYTWVNGISEAKNLTCPINQGGQVPQISHYGFGSFIIVKPTPTPTSAPTPSPTPEPTPEPTASPTPTPTPEPTPTPTTVVATETTEETTKQTEETTTTEESETTTSVDITTTTLEETTTPVTTTTADEEIPKTGEDFFPSIVIGIVLLSLAGVLTLFTRKLKKE